MGEFFLKVVNMSISASWIVLAVLLLRVLLKKAPKWITVLLWGVVAIRLICPFSIESIMSLIPSTETISPEIMMDTTPAINSGIPIINNAVNPVIEEALSPTLGDSVNPLQILIPILSIIWIVGIAVMLGYTVISYLRVKRKIGTAVILRDNIFQSESVVSPFVLGIIKPKIYLPFNMDKQDMEHVIAHENAHIRRKDYLWKPFGFLILTLHWFNPLMWLGYVLLCRDIELACDEKVIKELNTEQKADYSQALLTCSVNRRMIAACPLAFGEIGVKNRVKSVLNYKKPAFWIVIVAIIASVAATVCFLTNPVASNEKEMLLEVLNNERTFINESGETVYFKNHKPFDFIYAIPEKYALIDLDSDGTDELIVYNTQYYGTYTVFHIYNNKVYGYDFWERALVTLKTDGTFIQSGGAGLNRFVVLRFKNDKYNIVEQAYQNDTAKKYRINESSSTMEEVNTYIDEFYNKADVVWEKYETIKIQIVNQDLLDNYQINTEYYDTKSSSRDWKILLEAKTDIKNFRFIELNEAEVLKAGDALFELETLKANTPILLHTYINDVTLNRGISYQDDNGVVRYFALNIPLNGDSFSLSEIHLEQSSDGNITVSDKQIENRLLYNQISNKTYKICLQYNEEQYKKVELPTEREAVKEQLEFDIAVCNLAKKKGVSIDRDQTDSFAKSEFEIMKTDSSQEIYKEALFKVLEQENISQDKYMELGCEKAYYLYNTVALKQEFQKTYYDSSSKMNLDEQFEKYVLKNK